MCHLYIAIRDFVDGGVDGRSPSALGLVVIGMVLALNVTDIFNLFEMVFVSCFNRSWGCLCYQKRFLAYPMQCLFLVPDRENLDAFDQRKLVVTK